MNNKDNVKEEVKKEESPLFEAITRNDSVNDILDIIDRDPSAARQRGTNGNYPLHQACLFYDERKSHDLIVMKLLDLFPQAAQEKCRSDRRFDDYIGHYPLHIACHKLSDDAILKLLDLYPDATQIYYTEKFIGYPLHIAFCRRLSDGVIIKLMEVYPEAATREIRERFYYDDPDDNYHDYYMYPLHYACKIGFSVRVIQKLLEIYPRAMHQRSNGIYKGYPLDLAVTFNQNVDVVKLLVTTDPSILKIVNNGGCTPFHKACLTDRVDVIESLLQFPDLPINARCKAGYTPLHLACMSFGREMEVAFAMTLEHPDIDVNAIDVDGNSAIHILIQSRQFSLVDVLLNHHSIRIDEKNNNNQTPLDLINEKIIELTNCENGYYQKADLPRLMEIRNLLQDFLAKRKWQSYEYFHQNLDDWSSVK